MDFREATQIWCIYANGLSTHPEIKAHPPGLWDTLVAYLVGSSETFSIGPPESHFEPRIFPPTHLPVTLLRGHNVHFSLARKISHQCLSSSDDSQYRWQPCVKGYPGTDFFTVHRRFRRWYRCSKLTTDSLVQLSIIVIPMWQLMQLGHREVNRFVPDHNRKW